MLDWNASTAETASTRKMPFRGIVWRAVIAMVMLAVPVRGQIPPDVGSGDAYMAEVLATMERRPNVAAKLRYESRFGEAALVGAGNFWQLGTGPQRMTRWEMQTQVADKTASYVQVFDGRYLWTDKHLPSGRLVHRLDVANLKARLRSDTARPANRSGWDDLLSGAEYRGGLSQMLTDLLRRYQFDGRHSTKLNGFALDALIGRWRPEQFAELCPIDGDEQAWPTQMPHHVLVMVGSSNLFPYVIEFRRAEDAALADHPGGLKPAHDPLTRYEVFEVRFAEAIDSTVFQFKPGDVDWSDETSFVYDRVSKQHDEAQLAARRAAEQK